MLRSPLMVAALLGVLRAGCGYLPLDHHHPEARIDFMVEDAAVKVRQCSYRPQPSSAAWYFWCMLVLAYAARSM